MHILVPLDGSEYGQAAGRVALQLAAALPDARVTALHVVNVRVASGNLLRDLTGHLGFEPAVVSDEIEKQHVAAGRAVLGAFATEAKGRGIDVQMDLATGAVPAVIAERSAQADLVVMGLRGETEERFPGQGGRLAASLPSQMGTPLLLVPPGLSALRGVAVGYDGSTGARHAVRALRAVAGPLGLPVHGIYVRDGDADDAGDALMKELAESVAPLEVHPHLVASDDPHAAILDVALTEGIDLVALGFTGRSKLRDFAFGTLSETALLAGSTAVLIA